MADIRIVLEAEDNLTPELKKSLKEIQNLDAQITELGATIDQLKANKKSIIGGNIDSDIGDIKQLQAEVRKLEALKKTALADRTGGQTNAQLTAQINAKKVEIERQYTMELNKQKAALKSVATARTKAAFATNKLSTSESKNTAQMKKSDTVRKSMTNNLVRHIRQLETAIVAYYATQQAMKATVGYGITLNQQYEDQKTGLAALLAAKTSDITSTGRQVDAAEKFAIAQKQTAGVLEEIKIAATETPASFGQMTGFYQQAIGHALAANDAFGESVESISTNVIQLTKRMSNLGAGIGMDMSLVNEEIRSLMSGNVSRDSILSLILFGDPRQANEAIKEAKTRTNGLTDLLNKALEPFSALENVDTYTKLLAQMTAAYEDLAREATGDLFESLKGSVKRVTTLMKDNKDDILTYINVVSSYAVALGKSVIGFADGIAAVFGSIGSALNSIATQLSDGGSLGIVQQVMDGWIAIFTTLGALATNTSVLFTNIFLHIGERFDTFTTRMGLKVTNLLSEITDVYLDFYTMLRGDGSFGRAFMFDEQIEGLTKYKGKLEEEGRVAKKFIDTRMELFEEERAANEARLTAYDDLGQKVAQAVADAHDYNKVTKTQIALTDKLVQANAKVALANELIIKTIGSAVKYYKKQGDEVTNLADEYENLIDAMAIADSKVATPAIVKTLTEYYQKVMAEAYENSTENKVRTEFTTDYKKSTMTSVQFEMDALDEQYDYYAEFVNNKTQLDDWYAGRKKQITEKSNKDEQNSLKDIANAVNGVYKNLEDSLVEFAMTGEFVFKDMVNAILADLARLIIQMNIIRPLATATTTYFASANGNVISGGDIVPYATGGVINNYMSSSSNVSKFATGGIVSSPTLFPMNSGTGLMGEAGPEAILPLTRIGGDLGVKAQAANVIIQVSNESGLPMDMTQTGQSQNEDGDTIISTVLHHMNYDPDFRAAMRG